MSTNDRYMKFVSNLWMEIFRKVDYLLPKRETIQLENVKKVGKLTRVFGIITVLCVLHGAIGLVDAGVSSDIGACVPQPCQNGGTCEDGLHNYTCICPHLYNGTNCENDLGTYGCLVGPCLNGGTCVSEVTGDRNYRCDCKQGYAGINCEVNIDECGSSPCPNGVQCIDLIGDFQCNCTGLGYTGDLCNEDIDECDVTPNICGTSGDCYNTPGSFMCVCPDGQFGKPCQDIDECQSNPCNHSGTCENLVADYNCACVPGYRGKQCDEDIDDCATDTCPGQNSECKDLVNNYMCVCRPGYHGMPPTCEDINECQPDPCLNGAACSNLENNYTCSCILGYEGRNCSSNIDDCDPDPCQNGASCEDHLNNYTCSCVAGFEGRHCGTNINECEKFSTPCYNDGVCHDQVNDFNCSCARGYTGNLCETDIDECDPDPCNATHSNGCTHGVGFFTCSCILGYSGDLCENDINDCSPNPCQNGATCTDLVNEFKCTCTSAWMGEQCQSEYNACHAELGNCENAVNCTTSPPSHDFSCICVLGFDGDRCENNIEDCRLDSCTAPLVCHDGVNNYMCACPTGYEGASCDHRIDECRSRPCQNGANCTSGIGTYSCQCPRENITVPDDTGRWYIKGFEGVNCEQDIDECAVRPSICLNNGRCENSDGSVECKCGGTDGAYYLGSHCELITSYCFTSADVKDDLPACKHNGTCIAIEGDYSCECAPGFTERRCRVDIDECASNPCHFNGTCDDRIASYVCSCIDGITGPNCETNIDECEPNPCLQEAPCIDGINMFTCNCTDTGFKGVTCNENIDDCEPGPCQHESTCDDKIKDYFCNCFPGYLGKDCEIDVDECLMNPCDDNSYSGTCYEKSNETFYEIGTPGFENLNFSFANASGYVCDCIKGITGLNCETNIDDCVDDNCNYGTCVDLIDAYRCQCYPGYKGDNCKTEIDECLLYHPCQDRGTCTDKVADYECACNSMYRAGKNCTFVLTSCNTDNHNCQNEAACVPFLIDEATLQQGYDCVCTVGFTGRLCDISTTMSFDIGSQIRLTLDQLNDVSLSFRFRTTLQDGLLLAWPGIDSTGHFATVELKDGALHLLYHDRDQNGVLSKIILNRVFNDSEWQTVLLRVNSNGTFLIFKVESSSCMIESECLRMANYNSQISPDVNVYIGSLNDENDTESGTPFVGCMEDITYAGNKLVLDPSSQMFKRVSGGCPRKEQCLSDTCNKKGQCVDLWNDFRCDCHRPYLGRDCSTSYIAATFAYNNAVSWASFDLPQSQKVALRYNIDLSFFIRSRKVDGLILFLGNVNSNFMSLELLNGQLVVRFKICDTEMYFSTNSDVYADGEQHFVDLVRYNQGFNFSVDGVFYGHQEVQSNCVFDVNHILFGGLTEIPTPVRKKRQSIDFPDSLSDFASATHFKGTVQDVQLNSHSLQFFLLTDPSLSDLPAINMSNSATLEANEKTDPLCDMIGPCENNSTCSDVFFNDYRCDCLHGYRGKNCSELDFCVTGTCPEGSTCQSLLDGFECISTSTFNGQDSYAAYSHTLSNNSIIQTFSFKFRTLSLNGWLLSITNGNHYYKVKVIGSHIVVRYKLDDKERSVEAAYDSSDSKWYMAVVTETQDTVTLTISGSDEGNDISNVSSIKPTTAESLNSLLRDSSSEVKIGNSGSYDRRNPYYQGCLKEVRIGKILLPFFSDDLFINNTSIERFLLGAHRQIPSGCLAGSYCRYSQCQHGSDCFEDYYSYSCNCSSEYNGQWCQDRRDYCSVDSCLNGHCVSRADKYECMCPSGYTDSQCRTDVDECAVGVCQNNATCDNQNGTYTCNCTDMYTGDNCDISLNRTCSSHGSGPCDHGQCNNITITDAATAPDVESFNCSCDPGYHGYTCAVAIDYCENFPCLNGATCTSQPSTQNFNCGCVQGFTGDTCDTNVNDCPTVNSCQNDGECVDGLNSYTCNCTNSIYWTGQNCEVDIDECTVTQPCQNRGLCLDTEPGYTCACQETGFNGTTCADDIDECDTADPCLNGATCTNNIGSYECNCTVGYEGMNCDTANCTGVPCENQATCVENGDNSHWTCQCLEFYEGEFCGIKGRCADHPCVDSNTQLCSQNTTADTYNCSCVSGWKGDTCDTDIDECTTIANLCKNGASCVNLNGTYQCDCVFGYTSKHCDVNIDECSEQPCHNNGICIDGIGAFTCNCTETGYTNLTCLDDVNECNETIPCLHDGTCSNTDGSYDCSCMEGYEGKDCEVKRDALMEDDDITWFIVGPAVAVVLILIVIGVIWFLMCVRTKRATRGAYSPSRQEVTGSRVELGNVLKKPPPERLI